MLKIKGIVILDFHNGNIGKPIKEIE